VQQKQVPGRWTIGRNTEEEVEIQTEGFWKGFGRGSGRGFGRGWGKGRSYRGVLLARNTA